MKRIKLFIFSIAAVFTLSPALLATASVHAAADTTNETSQTINCGATGDLTSVTGAAAGTCTVNDTTTNVNGTIKFAIRIFQFVVGIISIVMIILGGLKYITSGGESSNITSAKNTILYAVVGLIVVVLAQIIVQFVLTKAQAL